MGPGYYAHAGRSASSLGIPRFHAATQRPKSPKSRTRSLAGSSPRLEYKGPAMASVESQEWYSGYQHQVPHDAEFGSSGSLGGLNSDGRIQAAIGRRGSTGGESGDIYSSLCYSLDYKVTLLVDTKRLVYSYLDGLLAARFSAGLNLAQFGNMTELSNKDQPNVV